MKKKKIALITGITGQDGAYLAKLLLKKNYKVFGIKRRTSTINTSRIDDIYQEDTSNKKNNFILKYGDVTDPANINSLINEILPDEVYNLAAQSHVQVSFATPLYTSMTNSLGVINILESIKELRSKKKIKFYQASTSEMFGNHTQKILNEKSNFKPVSPYGSSKVFAYWLTKNYRDSYDIFAVNGILFNHESPLRGETFISRKVSIHVAKKFLGEKKILRVGNLYSKRDWGHAEEDVEGMWKMMQHKEPQDLILATNKSYTVKEFIERAFKEINIKLKWVGKGLKEKALNSKTGEICVMVDEKYYRPNELHYLKGNPQKAFKNLKWKPKINFNTLIKEMVHSDIAKFENDKF